MRTDRKEKSRRLKLNRVISVVAASAALVLLVIIMTVPSVQDASAKYVSEFKQTVDLIVNPSKPVFTAGASWYRAETPKASICAISIAENDYVLTETEEEKLIESFYADINKKGSIKCYIVESTSGPSLIISGNGWNEGIWDDDCNTVYANTKANKMFAEFVSASAISGLENLDVSSCTDISYMFNNCKSVTRLDVADWKFCDSSISAGQMFFHCESLKALDLSRWVIKLSGMSQMFHSCKLTELDLSGFDTTAVTSTNYLFQGCSNLKTVKVSDKFNMNNVTNSTNMFGACSSIKGCHGTDVAKIDKTDRDGKATVKYACIDTTNHPGYFTGETVTITYHANGGEGDSYEQYVLPGKEDYLIDSRFSMTGYHVAGWSTEPAGSISYDEGQPDVSFSSDTDLYAIWETNPYIISFDSKGGTDVNPVERHFGDAYGELPVPEKTGYIFKGWDLKRLPDDYTEVEYIENSGKEYINTGVSGNNNSLVVETVFSYSSYGDYAAFFGNYINENTNVYRLILTNGGEKSKKAYAGINTKADSSVTAQDYFTKNDEHKVLLFRRDGKGVLSIDGHEDVREVVIGNENKTSIAIYGSKVGSATPIIIRYKTFKMSQGKTVLRDFVPCKTSTGAFGLYDLAGNGFFGNEGNGSFKGGPEAYHCVSSAAIVNTDYDHTLYAVWEEDPITVTFDANGGKEGNTTQLVLRNLETSLNENSFTRVGYSFTSWNTEADGSGSSYSDKEAAGFTSDTTLYAQWSPNSYTVYLDAQGGELDTEFVELVYDGSYGELPTPAREGYTFVGWSLDRLPDGYREVECIKNHTKDGKGQGYIDTGVSGNNDNLIVEATFAYSSHVRYGYFYGNYVDENHTAYRLMLHETDDEQGYSSVNMKAGASMTIENLTKNEWHTVRQYKGKDKQKYYTEVDGSAFEHVCTAATENNNNIVLFLCSLPTVNDRQNAVETSLAAFKMWNGDELIRDFVPCRETSSEAFGLYDLANYKFYGNGNTADDHKDFIGGPDAYVPAKPDTIVTIPWDHTLYAIWEED